MCVCVRVLTFISWQRVSCQTGYAGHTNNATANTISRSNSTAETAHTGANTDHATPHASANAGNAAAYANDTATRMIRISILGRIQRCLLVLQAECQIH